MNYYLTLRRRWSRCRVSRRIKQTVDFENNKKRYFRKIQLRLGPRPMSGH